jgi:hypothetical protein
MDLLYAQTGHLPGVDRFRQIQMNIESGQFTSCQLMKSPASPLQLPAAGRRIRHRNLLPSKKLLCPAPEYPRAVSRHPQSALYDSTIPLHHRSGNKLRSSNCKYTCRSHRGRDLAPPLPELGMMITILRALETLPRLMVSP